MQAGTVLPMMYIPDCLKATAQLLEADAKSLTQRTYNVAAMSFDPEQIAASIRKVSSHTPYPHHPTLLLVVSLLLVAAVCVCP